MSDNSSARAYTLGNAIRAGRLVFHWAPRAKAFVRITPETMPPRGLTIEITRDLPRGPQRGVGHAVWWDEESMATEVDALAAKLGLGTFRCDEHGVPVP